MRLADQAADAAGFVLAGGRSRRMGADKALVRLAGRPLVVHAIQILSTAGLPVSIAGSRSQLASFAPVIEDGEADQGPLAGMCAALASTAAQWAVFLSIDLPLLPPSLVALMLHYARITEAAVTVSSVNGFAQTFPAVMHRAALPTLGKELAAGRGGCFSAFHAVASSLCSPVAIQPVEPLVQSGQLVHPAAWPPVLWFLNVNTPADLCRAEKCYRFIA